MDIKLYNQSGKEVGKLPLPESVFNVPVKTQVLRQVLLAMMANERAGTAHTKFRDEVSGTGKKPWKQKGTGNARHGSKRSPIWVGGGVAHGPRSEKDYSQKINSKQKLRALSMLLTQKYSDRRIIPVEKIVLTDTKTKEASTAIDNLSKISDEFKTLATKKNPNNVLLVLPNENPELRRVFRNLPYVKVVAVRNLNPLVLSKARYVIFEDAKSTVAGLEEKIVNGLSKKINSLEVNN